MSKLKYALMITLLNAGLLMASTLETSDNLNNLEIITDTSCEKKSTNASSQTEAEVVSRTQDVETVNYTLHDCNGVASFPVTVRSNKRQGE